MRQNKEVKKFTREKEVITANKMQQQKQKQRASNDIARKEITHKLTIDSPKRVK